MTASRALEVERSLLVEEGRIAGPQLETHGFRSRSDCSKGLHLDLFQFRIRTKLDRYVAVGSLLKTRRTREGTGEMEQASNRVNSACRLSVALVAATALAVFLSGCCIGSSCKKGTHIECVAGCSESTGVFTSHGTGTYLLDETLKSQEERDAFCLDKAYEEKGSGGIKIPGGPTLVAPGKITCSVSKAKCVN